jgi:diguanylate cyclase (GGDEF)-like protein
VKTLIGAFRDHQAGMTPRLAMRRTQLLRRMAAKEAPRILFLFVAIIISFDVAYALIGIFPPFGYYLSDFVQVTIYIVVGVLLVRNLIAPRAVPWVVAGAILVGIGATSYQYSVIGDSAIGVILIVTVVSGPIILSWWPFSLYGVLTTLIAGSTIVVNDPENGPGWVVILLTALAGSAVVLYGRRRSALDLARAQQEVQDMAVEDPMTKALNRRGFLESAPLVVNIAHRNGESVFVSFIDVVGLKAVNDTYGHALGDIVIQRVAQALTKVCRDSDILARWGGDEFLILGTTPAPHASTLRDRVVDAIDCTGLEDRWKPLIRLGVATGDGRDLHDLIQRADVEMYVSDHADIGESSPPRDEPLDSSAN